MNRILFFLILILAASCSSQQTRYEYPFRNPNLTIGERTADLISRLTVEEKASLML